MRLLALAVLVPLAFVAGGSGLSLVVWDDWLRGVVVGSTALELAGLALAGWALDKKRIEVGGGAPLSTVVSRWVRRHVGRPRSETVELRGTSAGHGFLSGRLVTRPGASASLERRVEHLERRADEQDQRFVDVETRLREELRRVTDRYETRFAESKKRIRALEDRLSHMVADGVGPEALGLWWLALGVVLQSLVSVITWTA